VYVVEPELDVLGGLGKPGEEEEEEDPWKISTVYIKVVPWDGKCRLQFIHSTITVSTSDR